MKLIHQQAPGFPVTHVLLVFPRAGACLDPPARRGAARVMLQVMFAGAMGLTNAELHGRLETLGASMGYGLSNDHFTLRLVTLTENLEAALELFLGSLERPNFDAKEFQRIHAESISAFIADREESKSLRAQEAYLQRLYAEGPQGYQADGTLAGLQALTLDDLQQRYQDLLGRAEPVLAVLSDLDRKAVQARIAARIAEPPLREGLPFPWERYVPPQPKGRRVTVLADPGTLTDEVLLGGFTVSERDPEWHIHRMIALIFGGDMNSRLFRVLRGEHGFSYGASCWYETSHGHCPRNQVSPFTLYTFPTAEHTAQAVPMLLSLYEALCEEGITDEELQRGQQTLINSHPFKRDTPQKKLGLELESALYGVTVDDDATTREKMLGLTRQDVRRVLRATHHPRQGQLLLLGDPQRLEPIARGLPGVEQVEVVAAS